MAPSSIDSASASAVPAHLAWATLHEWEQRCGDAFYVVDVERFRHNYRTFLRCLRAVYANSHIAYSYKTNYTPRLCQLVDEEGGYAEVVSRLEYQLARRLGVSPSRIIYNGPYKPDDDLRQALFDGALVNLDSSDEVTRVVRLAAEASGRTFRVGIRCNVPVDASEAVSRFGFDVDGPEFADAVTTLRATPAVSLVSLHCHVATTHKSPQSYRRRTERMVEQCRELFPGGGPAMLDVGGGFFGPMAAALRRQFTVEVPRFEAYAAAVAEPVAAAFAGQPVGPALIIEPGTALVADAVSLVARVLMTKTIRGRRLAVCSGSVYDLKPTLHAKNPDLSVSRRRGVARPVGGDVTDIVGYTCMEHDCLYRGYPGDLAAGDYLRFDGAGAYTLVLKPPFIRPSLPIVAIDTAAGTVDVVKREQTFDDVFSSFELPRQAEDGGQHHLPSAADGHGAPR